MSDKKKVYAGTAYDNPATTAEARPTVANGDAAPPQAMAAAADNDDPASVRRGQSQNVLPGILGKQLRAAYGELLNTPVPDRFGELIKQLQLQEAGKDALPGSQDEKKEDK